MQRLDSFGTRRRLEVGARAYDWFSVPAAEAAGLGTLSRLPRSLKVLLENLLRNEDGRTVTSEHVHALCRWLETRSSAHEIPFYPGRVMMQDSGGIPLLADLAAMRDAIVARGGDPAVIAPQLPVDLIVDHSVIVDVAGRADALEQNMQREYARNGERYAFLRWAQRAFDGLRVFPPGIGICHQVNLEYLASVVADREQGGMRIAMPDTMLGTDSHTPMVNALGVLGWGVGGIEAGAAMLGQPVTLIVPEVIGCRLAGALRPGVTATDLVLTITERLRAHGVVQKFVEFFGPGLAQLPLADRATVANMAPEYGATVGFFPLDDHTLAYLARSGRGGERIALIEAYARAQGLWHEPTLPQPLFTDVLEFDLGAVAPSVAGPRRPHDRMPLSEVGRNADALLSQHAGSRALPAAEERHEPARVPESGGRHRLRDGDIVLAAITSCTNTSNPRSMLAAGLLARNAVARGLSSRPWVKTSLAPGSRLVADYLTHAGLQPGLDALGFQVVGFGCTTCMGNSGSLAAAIEAAIDAGDLSVAAVLSGNRNFEARVHRLCRLAYLCSPPLVVAYALAGTVRLDLQHEPLGLDSGGQPVYLADIWPSPDELEALERSLLVAERFTRLYHTATEGDARWAALPQPTGSTFPWDASSTYLRRPPFFDGMPAEPPALGDLVGMRPLALLGDSVTTDHISPIGVIAPDGPAGRYLQAQGVAPEAFNFFGARRVNHEVMVRGTFDNPRLRNEMVGDRPGGFTRVMPEGELATIHEAATRYRERGVPLVVIAGRDYGTGSSRDWAAKGTWLLGVRAVIAESFERIHRSNLIGMGVLPVQFEPGAGRRTLGLDGSETLDLVGLAGALSPGARLECRIRRHDGASQTIGLRCRLDTPLELEYFRHRGMLHLMLRRLSRDTRP